jgi:glutamine amidotransferase
VTDEADAISQADKIILPGVGAFRDGMLELESRGLKEPLFKAAQSGKLILGICLGMQLLFDESQEQGQHQGLGLIRGKVHIFNQSGIKIPQIGWNQVEIQKETPLLSKVKNGDYFYFNHSYYCSPDNNEEILALTDYGAPFASAVASGNLFGVQFHPEKSQNLGLLILKNFVEM